MALNGLLDIELSVPDPQALADFWLRHGLELSSDGVLGTASRPVQIRVAEGDHRHLSMMHLGCEQERDLHDIADRLGSLGVAANIEGTTLTCTDPVLGHRVVVEVVVAQPDPRAGAERHHNRPGEHRRLTARASVVHEAAPRPPRRLGHFVLGSPRIGDTNAFYIGGLGYRISDQIAGEHATFLRCERDHHNLLVHRAPTGFLNHYALEMDDIDAVGRAGNAVLAEQPDSSVAGIGRHYLGSNVFWYLRDPAGNMFEFFCDMDQIDDDDLWDREVGRRDWGTPERPAPFSTWGPPEPRDFARQPDLADIARAREARGLQ
jgi:catechol 2,3-dioxygenase-like lactoylglutathione lyase family enzyme